MPTFGDELRSARKAAGVTQRVLADRVSVTQAFIAQIETGKGGVERQPDIVARIETALGLPAGELARHLPDNHPAKRMAAVEIPVAGVVAAGIGCDSPADPGEVLRVSEQWAGCVAYRVRGTSMVAELIADGDYLIVRPTDQSKEGDIVVAWLANEGGHVVKKLADKGYLRSGGKTRWAHKLTEDDRVFGSLEAIVRLVAKR